MSTDEEWGRLRDHLLSLREDTKAVGEETGLPNVNLALLVWPHLKARLQRFPVPSLHVYADDAFSLNWYHLNEHGVVVWFTPDDDEECWIQQTSSRRVLSSTKHPLAGDAQIRDMAVCAERLLAKLFGIADSENKRAE